MGGLTSGLARLGKEAGPREMWRGGWALHAWARRGPQRGLLGAERASACSVVPCSSREEEWRDCFKAPARGLPWGHRRSRGGRHRADQGRSTPFPTMAPRGGTATGRRPAAPAGRERESHMGVRQRERGVEGEGERGRRAPACYSSSGEGALWRPSMAGR